MTMMMVYLFRNVIADSVSCNVGAGHANILQLFVREITSAANALEDARHLRGAPVGAVVHSIVEIEYFRRVLGGFEKRRGVSIGDSGRGERQEK